MRESGSEFEEEAREIQGERARDSVVVIKP